MTLKKFPALDCNLRLYIHIIFVITIIHLPYTSTSLRMCLKKYQKLKKAKNQNNKNTLTVNCD